MKRNIFLIGMPSSGKSTLGRRLAKELGYTFFDLDQQIAEDQQMSIPTIFKEKGEAYFRKVESRLLKGIRPDQRLLVATGGGVPCFFDNMEFINHNGLSVFLDVPPEELATRIRLHAKDDRPLLSGLSDLEAELTKKLEERRPFYSQAHLTMTTGEEVNQFIRDLPALLRSVGTV